MDAPAGRSTALPLLTDQPEQAGEPALLSTQRKLGSGSICQIGSQALSPLLQASGRPAFGTDKPRVFRRLGKGGRLRPSRKPCGGLQTFHTVSFPDQLEMPRSPAGKGRHPQQPAPPSFRLCSNRWWPHLQGVGQVRHLPRIQLPSLWHPTRGRRHTQGSVASDVLVSDGSSL